jgi:hypothetical protein
VLVPCTTEVLESSGLVDALSLAEEVSLHLSGLIASSESEN